LIDDDDDDDDADDVNMQQECVEDDKNMVPTHDSNILNKLND